MGVGGCRALADSYWLIADGFLNTLLENPPTDSAEEPYIEALVDEGVRSEQGVNSAHRVADSAQKPPRSR